MKRPWHKKRAKRNRARRPNELERFKVWVIHHGLIASFGKNPPCELLSTEPIGVNGAPFDHEPLPTSRP